MKSYIIKYIILFSVFSSFSLCNTASYAFAMDKNAIDYTHSVTRTKFFDMCKEKIVGATEDVCNCLADNTVANIDDNELKKCDSTQNYCISKVVEAAAMKAFTQDGITACVKKSEKPNTNNSQ